MECIFCKITNGEITSNILYEDDLVMVIMDANPVVDGHALVIPKKHYTDYQELSDNVAIHIINVAKKIGPQIMNKLKTTSLTLLVNYGDAQQVKHFHLHLLPNYGTSNSVATKTKEEVFNILKD